MMHSEPQFIIHHSSFIVSKALALRPGITSGVPLSVKRPRRLVLSRARVLAGLVTVCESVFHWRLQTLPDPLNQRSLDWSLINHRSLSMGIESGPITPRWRASSVPPEWGLALNIDGRSRSAAATGEFFH